MKTNQIKSITIHSAYGVEVEYYDGKIATVDPTLREMTDKAIRERKITIEHAISIVSQKMAKLRLHSLDKLTQEIDGKVGIVELFKIAFPEKEHFQLSENGLFVLSKHLVGCLEFSYDNKKNSFISRHYNKDWQIIGYFNVPNQLELFNYLLEKGYNVFGLSSEYVKEKAISKNNGSRDIGLVDMMDIDTY